MSFGYSVGDFITAADKSFQLFQAVIDSRKNAPRQVQLLAAEFDQFGNRLKDLHRILTQYGQSSYVGLQASDRTLEECQEFVQRYAALNDKGANKLKRGFQFARWTTEDKNVNRLRAQVTGHIQDMVLFENGMMM